MGAIQNGVRIETLVDPLRAWGLGLGGWAIRSPRRIRKYIVLQVQETTQMGFGARPNRARVGQGCVSSYLGYLSISFSVYYRSPRSTWGVVTEAGSSTTSDGIYVHVYCLLQVAVMESRSASASAPAPPAPDGSRIHWASHWTKNTQDAKTGKERSGMGQMHCST